MITPDHVGPIKPPPGLTDTLHSLAAAPGAGDFVSLSICAGVLVERLRRAGVNYRAKVVCGAYPDATADLAASIRGGSRPAETSHEKEAA
jgi:hypothetical protein